jgi:hypothetical protein
MSHNICVKERTDKLVVPEATGSTAPSQCALQQSSSMYKLTAIAGSPQEQIVDVV